MIEQIFKKIIFCFCAALDGRKRHWEKGRKVVDEHGKIIPPLPKSDKSAVVGDTER